MPDDELLLQFADDEDALAEARVTLDKFGDAFHYQLVMALHLEHQAAHLEELRRASKAADTCRVARLTTTPSPVRPSKRRSASKGVASGRARSWAGCNRGRERNPERGDSAATIHIRLSRWACSPTTSASGRRFG